MSESESSSGSENQETEATQEFDQPEAAAADEGKEYKLADESEVSTVEIDGKTLTKTESASLTEDQHKRASDVEGVTLVEAGKE